MGGPKVPYRPPFLGVPLTPRVVSDAPRAPLEGENIRAGALQYDIVPYIPRLIRKKRLNALPGRSAVLSGTVDQGFSTETDGFIHISRRGVAAPSDT